MLKEQNATNFRITAFGSIETYGIFYLKLITLCFNIETVYWYLLKLDSPNKNNLVFIENFLMYCELTSFLPDTSVLADIAAGVLTDRQLTEHLPILNADRLKSDE